MNWGEQSIVSSLKGRLVCRLPGVENLLERTIARDDGERRRHEVRVSSILRRTASSRGLPYFFQV